MPNDDGNGNDFDSAKGFVLGLLQSDNQEERRYGEVLALFAVKDAPETLSRGIEAAYSDNVEGIIGSAMTLMTVLEQTPTFSILAKTGKVDLIIMMLEMVRTAAHLYADSPGRWNEAMQALGVRPVEVSQTSSDVTDSGAESSAPTQEASRA